MLTAYEFGRTSGRYHGQLDFSMIDEERAKKFAQDLGIKKETEFMEGYRKGFYEGREAKKAGKYFQTPEEIYQKQKLYEDEQAMQCLDKHLEQEAWNKRNENDIDPRNVEDEEGIHDRNCICPLCLG